MLVAKNITSTFLMLTLFRTCSYTLGVGSRAHNDTQALEFDPL